MLYNGFKLIIFPVDGCFVNLLFFFYHKFFYFFLTGNQVVVCFCSVTFTVFAWCKSDDGFECFGEYKCIMITQE